MLDYTTFAKQAVDSQKSTVSSALNGFFLLQDQSEKFTNFIAENFADFSSEGKKMISEWDKLLKKGQSEYRKIIDNNINSISSLFAETVKPAKTVSK